MDINVSQIGQSLALPKVEIDTETAKSNKATQDSVTDSQQTKGLFIPAEINNYELNKEKLNKQNVVEVSAEKIENAVSQLTEILQTNNRKLNFSVDEDSNKQVVKVTDAVTGDIIRQIPSEEVLKLSECLQEFQLDESTVVGLLFNKLV
jgi:flagellar protein FlaG